MRIILIRLTIFLASFTILSGPVFGEPVGSISPISMNEIEKPAIDIAGAYIVGVMFMSKEPVNQRPSLRAHVPANWRASIVCVRGKSRDGIYSSKYEYKIPTAWAGNGVLNFKYPTDYSKRLRDSPPKDFGVVLQSGACAKKSVRYLAGYWNTVDGVENAGVTLLINSVGATEAFLFVGNDLQAPEVTCQKIIADQTIGYDFQCTIPKSQIRSSKISVEINTVKYGVRDPAIQIELLVR